MRAAALNFARCDLKTEQGFLDYVYHHVTPAAGDEPFLLVFPAHLALLYAFQRGDLGAVSGFAQAVSNFLELPPAWHSEYREMQSTITRHLLAYLVPGSTLVLDRGEIYHETCLISPGGELQGCQRQLFLSREERELGWCRGDTAAVFDTDLGKVAILTGTDAWYPEVGRVLALQGADIVCCCGAIRSEENKWRQLAGIWQQVQQNQFFCVESQLKATLAGDSWSAPSLIHAPCEMTEGFTGLLAGSLDSEEYGDYLEAELDRQARQDVMNSYPLLKLLNAAAYHCAAAPLPEAEHEA